MTRPWTTYWVSSNPWFPYRTREQFEVGRANTDAAPEFSPATFATLQALLAPVAHLAIESAQRRLDALNARKRRRRAKSAARGDENSAI